MIVWLLIMVLFVAVLAVACGFAANVLAPSSTIRKRALIAGLIAGFVPVVPGLFTLIPEGAGLVPIGSLFLGGFVLSALIGFPIAYLIAKRKPAPDTPDVFG